MVNDLVAMDLHFLTLVSFRSNCMKDNCCQMAIAQAHDVLLIVVGKVSICLEIS